MVGAGAPLGSDVQDSGLTQEDAMEYRGVEVDIRTKTVHGDSGWDPATGAVSFPVYQSATFRHASLAETTGWDYSRQSNPTRTELEQTVAALEEGSAGLAYSTGMAAVNAVMELFGTGDHLIVCEDLYGGVYRYLTELAGPRGIGFSFADPLTPESAEALRTPATRGLWIETPSNPLMRIADIAALAAWAHRHGILVIVDNTFLTPYLQQPLKLGADIVVHSGTKFLGGHNDTLAGFVVTGAARLANGTPVAERLRLLQKTTGAVLAPFDCWLMLRGLKTLAVRMDRQQENARALAAWLAEQPAVQAVYYPGLPGHPGREVNERQARGPGAMISFRVRDPARVERILREVRVVIFAESLGGTETLVTFPMTQTHAAIPAAVRQRLGVDDTLLRLSVGLEAVDDLIADLARVLA